MMYFLGYIHDQYLILEKQKDNSILGIATAAGPLSGQKIVDALNDAA